MNRLRSPRLMVDLVEQVDERGMAVSPTLPEGCKNLLIDIDGLRRHYGLYKFYGSRDVSFTM